MDVNLGENNRDRESNRAVHVFYLWKSDTLGSALSFDGDYYKYSSWQADYFANTYGSHPSVVFDSQQNLSLSSAIYSFKTDLIRKTAFATIEAGLKISGVNNTHIFSIDSMMAANQVAIAGFSNSFIYLEKIQSAYLSAVKRLKHLEIKAGLRYEYTFGHDRSKQLVLRRYGHLFPYASFNTQLGAHQITFSYRKSIMRPVYTNLNPFTHYSDLYNTIRGNPTLNPALGNIGEFNYVLNSTRLLTVNYIRMNNATLDVISYDSLVQISQPQSSGTLETWYLAPGQALQLAKFWSASTDIAAIYNRTVSPIQQGQWSWMAQLSTDLQIKKGWTINALGKYSSKSIYELSRLFPVWKISFGLKKTIAKGKGFLAVDVDDILHSDRYKASYNYHDIQQDTSEKWQSRTVKIALNYSFGNSNITLTNKSVNNTEEESRVK